MCKRLILIVILITLSTCCYGQSVVSLNQEQKLDLLVDHLKKAIQTENKFMFSEILDSSIIVKDSTWRFSKIADKVDEVISNAKQRSFAIKRPPAAVLTNLWDFDIINMVKTIKSDTAFVDCELVFWSTPVDSLHRSIKQGRRLPEQFIFIKKGGGWSLSKVTNLFRFLETFGDIRANP